MDDGSAERLESLARGAGRGSFRVEPLPGDVGRRRYFRLFPPRGESLVGVVYPEAERDALTRWSRLRETLFGAGVRVPAVIADDGAGAQLIEDFGEASLSQRWQHAGPARRASLWRDAAAVAARIAAIPDPSINPPFSPELFLREMRLSADSVFTLAGLPLSPAETGAHEEFARSLAQEIAAHPRVLLHRDFHADNLYDLGSAIGVIDFQDARLGPDSYDVAALTEERAACREPDPEASRLAVETFARQSGRDGLFRERLARVLVQRLWKASGSFAAAYARTGREAYRALLPAHLARLRPLLRPRGAEGDFARILDSRSDRLSRA